MPTPALRATASRLASAPPALNTSRAATSSRSRLRSESARGFRPPRADDFDVTVTPVHSNSMSVVTGIEKAAADLDLAITCGVCHDPHNGQYEGQLRRPIATVSVEEHLCASCHDRRTVPDPTSSHGLEPHAPETALLAGDAGWFPPNANIDQGEIIAIPVTDSTGGRCQAYAVDRQCNVTHCIR